MLCRIQYFLAVIGLALLVGCVSAPPPAAEPPQEAALRAVFAQFAIALAQSGFIAEPGTQVLLKPTVNRAATQMYSEAKPKELVSGTSPNR